MTLALEHRAEWTGYPVWENRLTLVTVAVKARKNFCMIEVMRSMLAGYCSGFTHIGSVYALATGYVMFEVVELVFAVLLAVGSKCRPFIVHDIGFGGIGFVGIGLGDVGFDDIGFSKDCE